MEWFLLVGSLELITQTPDREFDRSVMNILKNCL